jgi:hypothetical protein
MKCFRKLFKKEDKGLLLNEVRILSPNYTHELDNDFTVQEVNKFILSMKNNKATGCDGIPNEAWKMLVNRLAPSDQYMGRIAHLSSRRCILITYSTNI